MKKILVALMTIIAFTASYSFAAGTPDKGGHGAKKEHEITVGNDKAAASGSTADDKTAKTENTNKAHGKNHKKN